MTQITTQCRLVAPAETRRHLWHLMADIYTPFINEMLARIAQHPDFAQWSQTGRIPADLFETLRKAIKEEWADRWMPGRWSYAARELVRRIYKSWMTLRRRLRHQWVGQSRWLETLQSDDELVERCGLPLEAIRTEAAQILAQHSPSKKPSPKAAKPPKSAKGKAKAKTAKPQNPSLYPQ